MLPHDLVVESASKTNFEFSVVYFEYNTQIGLNGKKLQADQFLDLGVMLHCLVILAHIR